jgi:hypothetical protein
VNTVADFVSSIFWCLSGQSTVSKQCFDATGDGDPILLLAMLVMLGCKPIKLAKESSSHNQSLDEKLERALGFKDTLVFSAIELCQILQFGGGKFVKVIFGVGSAIDEPSKNFFGGISRAVIASVCHHSATERMLVCSCKISKL